MHLPAAPPPFIIPNIRPSQPDSSFSPRSPFPLQMNSPVISLPPPSRCSPLQAPVAPMVYESGAYALSSNPPNPKANFRFGDWMYVAFLDRRITPWLTPLVATSCPSVSCAAHNFGYVPLATPRLLAQTEFHLIGGIRVASGAGQAVLRLVRWPFNNPDACLLPRGSHPVFRP